MEEGNQDQLAQQQGPRLSCEDVPAASKPSLPTPWADVHIQRSLNSVLAVTLARRAFGTRFTYEDTEAQRG